MEIKTIIETDTLRFNLPVEHCDLFDDYLRVCIWEELRRSLEFQFRDMGTLIRESFYTVGILDP
jgi:hypothetical protein